MAALQCELCGGKLQGKPGGIFECDCCGMEYSTEWAKEKIQQIKGTVQVEGTVQVTGTVTVDGPVEIKGGVDVRGLIDRGNDALLYQKWEEAKSLFSRALDYESTNADAYLGLVAVEYKEISTLSLQFRVKERGPLQGSNYWNARKYSKKIAEVFNDCNREYEEKKARQAAEAAERARAEAAEKAAAEAREEQLVEEENRRREAKCAELDAFCTKLARPCDSMVAAGDYHAIAVQSDGTLLITPSKGITYDAVHRWNHAVAVAASQWITAVLHDDGTASVDPESSFGDRDYTCVKRWKGVKKLIIKEHILAGLFEDGSVHFCGHDRTKGYRPVDLWGNMRSVAIGDRGHVLGLWRRGTVSVAGPVDWHCADGVEQWEDIIDVAANSYHSYGLDIHGNVYCNTSRLEAFCGKGVIKICAAGNHVIGLCADGTVLADGENEYGACDVSGWKNIVAISTGLRQTVGLCADGTVVATKYISDSIYKDKGQCNVSRWRLFQSLDTLPQERQAHFDKLREQSQRKRTALLAEKEKLQAELEKRSGPRRSKIESKLQALEQELQTLR